jgi:hypothetical protein
MQDQSSVVSQLLKRACSILDRARDDFVVVAAVPNSCEHLGRLTVPKLKGRGLFRSEHEGGMLARISICQGQSGEICGKFCGLMTSD